MSSEKNENSKVIWYILFAFITVVMLYLFTVVYFYYISPYNVMLKITFWPFVSQDVVEEMYLDATVEMNFTIYDEDVLEDVPVSVVGVNVRQDGYIVAPYHKLKNCDENVSIEIKTNRNGVYSGKILYCDKNTNLALVKCENYEGDEKSINIPFVSVSKDNQKITKENEIVALSSPMDEKSVWTAEVLTSDQIDFCQTQVIDGREVVDFVVENCFNVDVDIAGTKVYQGGAVFDLKGYCYGLALYQNSEYTVLPIAPINMFLDDVVESYKNDEAYTNSLVEKFIGFDQTELEKHIELSSASTVDAEKEQFYFQNAWQTYTYDILHYANAQVSGYYLFSDFVYGESKIDADNFVTSIKFDKQTYSVKDKIDLLEVLYVIKKGEEVTICYYPAETLEGLQSITFVV